MKPYMNRAEWVGIFFAVLIIFASIVGLLLSQVFYSKTIAYLIAFVLSPLILLYLTYIHIQELAEIVKTRFYETQRGKIRFQVLTVIIIFTVISQFIITHVADLIYGQCFLDKSIYPYCNHTKYTVYYNFIVFVVIVLYSMYKIIGLYKFMNISFRFNTRT